MTETFFKSVALDEMSKKGLTRGMKDINTSRISRFYFLSNLHLSRVVQKRKSDGMAFIVSSLI
jgi:hypothetical protein